MSSVRAAARSGGEVDLYQEAVGGGQAEGPAPRPGELPFLHVDLHHLPGEGGPDHALLEVPLRLLHLQAGGLHLEPEEAEVVLPFQAGQGLLGVLVGALRLEVLGLEALELKGGQGAQGEEGLPLLVAALGRGELSLGGGELGF